MKNKIESLELEKAINTVKTNKEEKGIIPKSEKKIVIINGEKDFSGMTLKISKALYKNNQNYVYKAGTKWEDIDIFGKKNIKFTENDFK